MSRSQRGETYLVSLTGLARSTVYLYVKGEKAPSVAFLLTISKEFNVSCDALLKNDLEKQGVDTLQVDTGSQEKINVMQSTIDTQGKLIAMQEKEIERLEKEGKTLTGQLQICKASKKQNTGIEKDTTRSVPASKQELEG